MTTHKQQSENAYKKGYEQAKKDFEESTDNLWAIRGYKQAKKGFDFEELIDNLWAIFGFVLIVIGIIEFESWKSFVFFGMALFILILDAISMRRRRLND